MKIYVVAPRFGERVLMRGCKIGFKGVIWKIITKFLLLPLLHTGLWLRTGCVTNAQVSFFGRTGF